MNATFSFPVLEPSQIPEARRKAVAMAERLRFTEPRTGQVALIVTELATNLEKHARGGEILLRSLDRGNGTMPDGIEILALDRGPGMPDVARSRQNGVSTTGTLGHGLGAIGRLADYFDVFTQPSGTAAVARIWREKAQAPEGERGLEIGAVSVAKPGEQVCGDAWAWRLSNERLAILVVDGLGHGLQAHEAARLATTTFHATSASAPHRIVEALHAALRSTRGAAVAVLSLDLRRDVATYCGLGNISSRMLAGSADRQSMVSHNGTAGHTASRIQEFTYPVPMETLIVMHTDGLTSHWDLAAYGGLRRRHPSLVSGILYRDFSRGRDDVSVVAIARRNRFPSRGTASDTL